MTYKHTKVDSFKIRAQFLAGDNAAETSSQPIQFRKSSFNQSGSLVDGHKENKLELRTRTATGFHSEDLWDRFVPVQPLQSMMLRIIDNF